MTLYLDGRAGWLNGSGQRSWVVGTALAVVAWLLVAPLLRRYAFAERAIPSVFADLSGEYDDLAASYAGLGETERCAAAVVSTHLAEAAAALGVGDHEPRAVAGLTWTLGTGYIGVWRRLHRAREKLLTVVPVDRVVAVAMEYRSRLRGSRIANAAGFTRELELAVMQLDQTMSRYLDADRPPTAAAAVASPASTLPPPTAASTTPQGVAASPANETAARLVV